MLYGSVDKSRWASRKDCAKCHKSFGFGILASKLNCNKCGEMLCKDCCKAEIALTNNPTALFKVCKECFDLVSAIQRMDMEDAIQDGHHQPTSFPTEQIVKEEPAQSYATDHLAPVRPASAQASAKVDELPEEDETFFQSASSGSEVELELEQNPQEHRAGSLPPPGEESEIAKPMPPTPQPYTNGPPPMYQQPTPTYAPQHAQQISHLAAPQVAHGCNQPHEYNPSMPYAQQPPKYYQDPAQQLPPNQQASAQPTLSNHSDAVSSNKQQVDDIHPPTPTAYGKVPGNPQVPPKAAGGQNAVAALSKTPTLGKNKPAVATNKKQIPATQQSSIHVTTGHATEIAIQQANAGPSNAKILLILPTLSAVRETESKMKNITTTVVSLRFVINEIPVGQKKSVCLTSALDVALTLANAAQTKSSPFEKFTSIVFCVGNKKISFDAQLVLWLLRDLNGTVLPLPPVIMCSESRGLTDIAMDYLNDVARPGSAVDKIIAFSPGAAPSLLSFLCLPNCKDLWDAATLISEDRPQMADTAIVSLGLASADGVPTALGQLVAPLAVALECSLEAGCAAAMLAALGYPLVGAVIAMNFDQTKLKDVLSNSLSFAKKIQTEGTKQQDATILHLKRVLKALSALKILPHCFTQKEVADLSTAIGSPVTLAVLNGFFNVGKGAVTPVLSVCFWPTLRCQLLEGKSPKLLLPGNCALQAQDEFFGQILSARWHVNYCLNTLLTGNRTVPSDLSALARQRTASVAKLSNAISTIQTEAIAEEGLENGDFIVEGYEALTGHGVGILCTYFENISTGHPPNAGKK